MSRFRTQQDKKPTATLYKVVFGSLYVKSAVFSLLLFMLIQPVATIYAAEEFVTETEMSQSNPESEPEPMTVEVVEEEVEVIVEQDEVTDEEDIEEIPEPEMIEIVDDEIIVLTNDVDENTADPSLEVEKVESEVVAEGGEIVTEPETETSEVSDGGLVEDEENLLSLGDESAASSFANSTDGEINLHELATSTESILVDHAKASTSANVVVSSQGGGSAGDENVVVTDNDVSVSTTTENLVDGTESAVEDELLITDQDNSKEVVVDTNEILEEETLEVSGQVLGTSTVEVPEPEYIEVTSSEDPFAFNEAECVLVGDGSFYCSKEDALTGVDTADLEVYSQIDGEGDYEIYFNEKGELIQITDNKYNDYAPHFDPVSNSLVWHRLIDGRYEIIHYNLDDKEEVNLTNNDVNDMEPSHEGDYVVWQRWVDGNWEIILYDGVSELQITNNSVHDLAPDIQGGYVIWHTSDTAKERQVAVYEIDTGMLSYIDDSEGGQVVNPRFVLVYDTKFENGDVITKGYDPATGEVVPLSAQTGNLPVKVPEPEPTGETTALLQNKNPNSKEELLDSVTPSDSDGKDKATTTSVTTVVTSPDTQGDNSSSTDLFVAEIDQATSTDEILPLTDFDLIIEPYNASSSAQQDDSATTTNGVE